MKLLLTLPLFLPLLLFPGDKERITNCIDSGVTPDYCHLVHLGR